MAAGCSDDRIPSNRRVWIAMTVLSRPSIQALCLRRGPGPAMQTSKIISKNTAWVLIRHQRKCENTKAFEAIDRSVADITALATLLAALEHPLSAPLLFVHAVSHWARSSLPDKRIYIGGNSPYTVAVCLF